MDFSMLILKNLLTEYFENFNQLIDILIKNFGNKFILYFQINDLEGFEYQNLENFVAQNNFPEHLSDFADSHLQPAITLKFFCQLQEIYAGFNAQAFYDELKRDQNKLLFYLTPYEDSVSSEKSIILESHFAITFKFQNNTLKETFYFSEDGNNILKNIQLEIKNLFRTPINGRKNIPSQNLEQCNYIADPNTIDAINKAKIHMQQGDCYLANIAYTKKLLENELKKFPTAHDFFASWLEIFSRFGVYLNYDNIGLASFTPERYLYYKNNYLLTEPIKGTFKTNNNIPSKQDAAALWNNKKEIYEHTLVVDLLRNDLHEFCKPASVQVVKPFFARIAGKLLQMQSFIFGEVEEDFTLGLCLEKSLPAGSITGTPKKRVCEIIRELETNRRGYYTGICGVKLPDGEFEAIILIRTLFQGNLGHYVGVGAGITTLSQTCSEYAELNIKFNSFLPIFTKANL